MPSRLVDGCNSPNLKTAAGNTLKFKVKIKVKIVVRDGVQLWKDGPYWAETNIGADNPEDYGLYFWWGDTKGYRPSSKGKFSFNFDESNDTIYTYDKSESKLQSAGWLTSDEVLTPKHDAAHVHWGGNWRMPTTQEFFDLICNCTWKWTKKNGVNGWKVRGKGTYASASIFLPAAGYGERTSFYVDGSVGGYWSSVPNSDNYGTGVYFAWGLSFGSGGRLMDYYTPRFWGFAIRPVQGSAK